MEWASLTQAGRNCSSFDNNTVLVVMQRLHPMVTVKHRYLGMCLQGELNKVSKNNQVKWRSAQTT